MKKKDKSPPYEPPTVQLKRWLIEPHATQTGPSSVLTAVDERHAVQKYMDMAYATQTKILVTELPMYPAIYVRDQTTFRPQA